MTPEDEMILFAVLQDIADELRRIKREKREAERQRYQKQTADQQTTINPSVIEMFREESHS